MVKIELLSTNGINTHWDVYYLNDVNADSILFADNVEISSAGDFVELDIPSDWLCITMMPKDIIDVEVLWYSGSI